MTDEKIAPNTILPPTAELIKVVSLKLGGWKEHKFDAKLVYKGVTWYRCHRGMGGEGRREDWCADVPSIGVSVHDYHWNGNTFGFFDYGSIEAAMDGELKRGITTARRRALEAQESLAALEDAVRFFETITV